MMNAKYKKIAMTALLLAASTCLFGCHSSHDMDSDRTTDVQTTDDAGDTAAQEVEETAPLTMAEKWEAGEYVTLEEYDENAGSSADYDCSYAMTQALNSGYPISLDDEKTYYISPGIEIYDDAAIYGGTIRVEPSESKTSALVLSADDLELTMEGVILYSENLYADTEHGDTVLTSNVYGINCWFDCDIIVEDCHFYGLLQGIGAGWANSVTVRDSIFDQCLTPIYTASTDLELTNCVLESIAANPLHHALYVSTEEIGDHQITDCTFTCSNSENESTVQYYNGSARMSGTAYLTNCSFDGNFIDNNNTCVLEGCTIGGMIPYNGTYYNCQIHDILTKYENSSERIYCEGCVITGTIEMSYGDVILVDNEITYSETSESVIVINGGDRFECTGNTITSQSPAAVLQVNRQPQEYVVENNAVTAQNTGAL